MKPSVEYLSRLLAYDGWANREALESIRDTKLHRSRKLLGHILSAEWVWLSRINEAKYDGVTWPEWSFDECEVQMRAVESGWAECIDSVATDGAIRRVHYSVKNVSIDVSAADVVTHVVVHSSYHRGQIATDQRLAGQGPPFTDYMECLQKGILG